MWAASAGLIGYCSQKVKKDLDNGKVPLMGVLGAFIFAAQMINFSIPATGSSGHLGGGMILAILLGPHAAFLTIASVLTVQSLFFADGGLLALGCNIFNLGFFPCFIAYPLIYKRIAGAGASRAGIIAGSLAAALLGLELGAFGVVLQTVFSGITELPFKGFLFLMLPIHLGIGLVEGAATAAVVLFIRKLRPEILDRAAGGAPRPRPVPERPRRDDPLPRGLGAGPHRGAGGRRPAGAGPRARAQRGSAARNRAGAGRMPVPVRPGME